MAKSIVFIDSEIGVKDKKIKDLGAVKMDGTSFHSAFLSKFYDFISNSEYICGHNIINHDLKYLKPLLPQSYKCVPIDTLYLSPLLFPQKPYHKLLKDDKLQSDQLNNPLNDAEKAKQLFNDEVNAFYALNSKRKQIFSCLLYPFIEFKYFFEYIGFISLRKDVDKLIKIEYQGLICENADIEALIQNYPKELAYALALIGVKDRYSIIPPWLEKSFPAIDNVIKLLCNTICKEGCSYCKNKLNIHKKLKDLFGFDNFRKYNGEPLQENATQAAVENKSLLAVFPTGGGKSITFQLPALMAGENVHGLTIIISPLQSLMKDQVDNLNNQNIVDAVTINGLLSPIERAEAIERVSNGLASMLYISPEQLRSRSIERLLLSRNVVRFVIDEAHCFSAWGQDFRVDYLYIGDFIKELQKKKHSKYPIPISCFTATAKQKVITDICDYFKRKLDINLELYTSTADRENLHYCVLHKETEEEKYNTLRTLIQEKNCPTIVYVSRIRRTIALAEKLTGDGFPAKPYNGQMEASEKSANQDAFIKNEIKVIVATSAFGMGVDKKDVKLVVHYDISDSLENYIQEAGRAGRNSAIQADCYVLFNDSDLDKHFILLNQTKLSISEIQQIWKALKDLTKIRRKICCSPLEIARQAGWDDSVTDIETRVKTAISALETAGYLKRGRNVPQVYATSILAKNMEEASNKIEKSTLIPTAQKMNCKRIIKSLISSRSIAEAGNDDAESRVDVLADILGIDKSIVVDAVNMMRQEEILADTMDMSAYILRSDNQNKSAQILERFAKLENFILEHIDDIDFCSSYKEINEAAQNANISFSSVKNIRTILYFWTIKEYIKKPHKNTLDDDDSDFADVNSDALIVPSMEKTKLLNKYYRRIDISRFIVENLYKKVQLKTNDKEEILVEFSLVGLFQEYQKRTQISFFNEQITLKDVEDALLYLSKIGAMKLEGGFLVLYNGMEVERLILDNKIRYKMDDYRTLSDYYKQKIQQIHIVGEYANLMVKDYNAAIQFVHDYFQMDFKRFISKYFKGDRAKEIERNITPDKYNQLFGELSDIQAKIINDAESKYIVVAAGPGSGKTRVLVHKLASLLMLEDVKHEQLLMVTFSRAAATEFKKRLIKLIGNAANFVEIKTFHSYCFDLLGKIGNIEKSENVVHDAAQMIENGEVEQGRITKSVLVIDEAQDMDENEFRLIRALMMNNEDMRVIAVGDDDQNIYEFRGSDSKYMNLLINKYGATRYEMVENYRSKANIVALANVFVKSIDCRMKNIPIEAIDNSNGTVKLIRYYTDNLEEPIVNQIAKTYKDGKACVLTSTNDEALRIMGLLNKKGIRAKLIQSLDGFFLYNLVEIRFFLKMIDKKCHTPTISKEIWEYAKQRLIEVYCNSTCLENCLNLVAEFETINSYSKYRTDLEEFIKESQYEDFYTDDLETVYVSTIHKAKGKEFDNVYMLLNNYKIDDDASKRLLYVGMTRAKNNLYINYNNNLFSSINILGVEKTEDRNNYYAPKEITLQLTHRDVNLGFFKNKKELIFKLRSGMKLNINEEFLSAEIDNRTVMIVKFSKAKIEELKNLEQRGYILCGADVRFIVAWKDENDNEETAIVLPNLYLKVNNKS